MYKIIRYIIDVSDEENEKIISENCYQYKDLPTAIFEFNKLRKADRAMYRMVLNNMKNHDCIFDDWHNETSYMFRIKDTCIECDFIDLIKEAFKLYRLDN